MITKRISYLFYTRSQKKSAIEEVGASGKQAAIDIPIYFRITVEGQRAEISTGETTTTDNWNQAKGKIKGNSETVRIINARLDSFLDRKSVV